MTIIIAYSLLLMTYLNLKSLNWNCTINDASMKAGTAFFQCFRMFLLLTLNRGKFPALVCRWISDANRCDSNQDRQFINFIQTGITKINALKIATSTLSCKYMHIQTYICIEMEQLRSDLTDIEWSTFTEKLANVWGEEKKPPKPDNNTFILNRNTNGICTIGTA